MVVPQVQPALQRTVCIDQDVLRLQVAVDDVQLMTVPGSSVGKGSSSVLKSTPWRPGTAGNFGQFLDILRFGYYHFLREQGSQISKFDKIQPGITVEPK